MGSYEGSLQLVFVAWYFIYYSKIVKKSGVLDVEVKELHQSDCRNDSVGWAVQADYYVLSAHHYLPKDLFSCVFQVKKSIFWNFGRIFFVFELEVVSNSHPKLARQTVTWLRFHYLRISLKSLLNTTPTNFRSESTTLIQTLLWISVISRKASIRVWSLCMCLSLM